MATFSHTSSNWVAGNLSTVSAANGSTLVGGDLVQAVASTDSLGNAILQLEDSGLNVANFSTTVVGPTIVTTVTLTASQVIAAYATPISLIAPAGTGVSILVSKAIILTNSTGNTAFATITAPIIQYGTTVHGAGTAATGSGLVAGDITAAANQIRVVGASAAALSGVSGLGVTFSSTAAATSGTGSTVSITLEYRLVTQAN